MARQKKTQPPYWTELSEGVMKIHLSGDTLPDRAFLEILELMKKNRESPQPRAVCFVVSDSTMMTVRYAFPSAFYEAVVLEQQAQAIDLERLQNAVGM
ncbi:MAG: hypothetical protein HFG19_09475 [Oscillospiraceae bacterium]|nr:hypothetical protein [Oscillospiraceae bacterium]